MSQAIEDKSPETDVILKVFERNANGLDEIADELIQDLKDIERRRLGCGRRCKLHDAGSELVARKVSADDAIVFYQTRAKRQSRPGEVRNSESRKATAGIFNEGTLLLDSCTLADNSSDIPGVETYGGAIWSQTDMAGRTLTLSNCTLTENNAGSAGGAIYNLRA